MSFNPAMFLSSTTTAAMSMLDTETVTITRATPGATPGTFEAPTTVYEGPADLQIGTGSIYYNPGGTVEQADGVLTIDPQAGVLPALKVNDVVAITDGPDYTIVQVTVWNFAPMHVEAMIKRGPAASYGPMK